MPKFPGILNLAELFLSSAVHLIFGLYIFSAAITGDLSQSLTSSLRPVWDTPVAGINGGRRSSESATDGAIPPIVLVHGIFGFGKGRLGGLSYFAGAEKKDEHVLVPDLGSLTSVHDRARDLFYYLKGGRVDYGEEHSKICGHSQFGKIYEQGHYAIWDEDHPIHFVGHSAGAQVIRLLQRMLAHKAWQLEALEAYMPASNLSGRRHHL